MEAGEVTNKTRASRLQAKLAHWDQSAFPAEAEAVAGGLVLLMVDPVAAVECTVESDQLELSAKETTVAMVPSSTPQVVVVEPVGWEVTPHPLVAQTRAVLVELV